MHAYLINWLEALGFKYSTRRKTYYVDGHERPDNVEYRLEYIRRYLSNERRCFRWLQLPIVEVEKLEKDDKFFCRTCGYEYKDESNNTYFEFHVDAHESFQDKCNHLPFGGNLSIRKNKDEKPLIFIGQDESIFKQFTLTSKQWCLPNGACAPNPKDDGQGVMLSSFVSRDFGYGHDLNSTQLDQINIFRSGKKYLDEESAIEIYGKADKGLLTKSPFIRWLEYGQNNEGYWNYAHMIIQLEDVVDVIKVLYGDKFEFIFYFGHSSGHDCLRPDGLNNLESTSYFVECNQK